jgi:asparagine synthase (glutamine-hydrolysing)
MSGFLVFPNACCDSVAKIEKRYNQPISAMLKKKLTQSRTIMAGQSLLMLFANPHYDPADSIWGEQNGDFCVYTGTLIYHGKIGKPACELLYHEFIRNEMIPPEDIYGNYCVFICHRENLYLFTDYAGLYHVYCTADSNVITNSFLSAATALDKIEINEQELYEYILHAAVFGNKTYLKDVVLYDPGSMLQIYSGRISIIRRPDLWAQSAETFSRLSVEEHLDYAIQMGIRYYQQVADLFGDQVTGALSGGHDSRLMLAFLWKVGVSPRLYVYGSDTSVDVIVSKMICERFHLSLDHVDRASTPPLSVEDYWQGRNTIFHQMDGLSPYGFVCDPTEIELRCKRLSGGILAINGGSGEIWRNFWELPDRRYTALDIVTSYYDRIPENVPTTKFQRKNHYHTLAEKLAVTINTSDTIMGRAYVEAAYPKFRVRYWQGKNNSTNNLLGKALTPFAETCFTIPSMWIPVRYKDGGWFERQMIIRMNSELAMCPSAYGYTLYDGPQLLRRAKSLLVRNVSVRARSYLLKIIQGRGSMPYYLNKEYISAYFGDGSTEISQYINLEACSGATYSRALTVERILRGNIL